MTVKNEIVVDHIKPEWFRREIAEAIGNRDRITLQIYHGEKFLNEYPIVFTDRRKINNRR